MAHGELLDIHPHQRVCFPQQATLQIPKHRSGHPYRAQYNMKIQALFKHRR